MKTKTLETRIISSLEKVFADEEINAVEFNKSTILKNEVFSFQVAYRWKNFMMNDVKVNVVSDIVSQVTIRQVGLIPSEMPCYYDHDDNILRSLPGLYPDALMPLKEEGLTLLPYQWRSLWITVNPHNNIAPGKHSIVIIFKSPTDDELAREEFQLEVIDAELPAQSLIHTQWFHSDCLATWYKVGVFSEEYWNIVEKYIRTAVDHGINMILTPLFTPPLDTAIGEERPTVQLVDIVKEGSSYKFGFSRLKRWISMCLRNDVRYFEFSHLFTQWGAEHAPKIMAEENGELKRIFGWETDATGEEYRNFLDQFLPELVSFIKENRIEDLSYFHVSDEPSTVHYESYKNARSIISKHLEGFPIIDALSDYRFYETGLVKNPIPSSSHLEPFLENNVPNLWTYYCCGQYQEVSNRFFNMPSTRNRILGMQLYKFNICGFLQWGYNFWYSQYSRYPIDPFKVTDAGHAFPSGDAFIVYPGKGEPIESLRFEVFREGLQDLRSLKLLEELIGREETIKILESDLDNPLTFKQYPSCSEWILSKRELINRKIQEHTKA